MKHLFILICSLMLFQVSKSQSIMEKENVENAVRQFVKAADQRLEVLVDQVLDENFRAVINRAFGSDELTLISKTTYLEMLKQGKLGGDDREIEILLTDINGLNAVVKARLKGKAMVFTTYLSLVKNKDNRWLIVSDQPHVQKL